MADPIYLNALRAARELWYDEQNLGELTEDLEPVPHEGSAGLRCGPCCPAARGDENRPLKERRLKSLEENRLRKNSAGKLGL